jgi:hypothetical protein
LDESRGSSVTIAASVRAALPGFDFWEEQGFSSSQPRTDRSWDPRSFLFNGWVFFPEVKQPGHEADHLPPSNAMPT